MREEVSQALNSGVVSHVAWLDIIETAAEDRFFFFFFFFFRLVVLRISVCKSD